MLVDIDDPYLATHEYAYLYRVNHGEWKIHQDQDDVYFWDYWTFLSAHIENHSTEIHNDTGIIEQKFVWHGKVFSALWIRAETKSSEGAPDIIQWTEAMPKPNGQLELF